MGATAVTGQDLLIIEASRSHSYTPHSVELLWTRWWARLRALYTWQPTTLTRETHPCPGGIRTRNPRKGTSTDSHLRPRGLWDRRVEMC